MLKRLVFIIVWLCFASLAHADESRVHLTFHRPVRSMCPSGRVLESDVEQLEGRKVFFKEEDADILVHGGVEDLPTGVHVHLDARTADGVLIGTRELTAEPGECASLRSALGLVLTMLIDADERPQAHAAKRRRTLMLGAEVAMLGGTLPRSTAGFGLMVGLAIHRRFAVRAGADYWLPVSIETARGVGADVHAYSFDLSLCPRLSRESRSFAVWFCGGTQLGQFSFRPQKLMGPHRQDRLLAQLVFELKLSVRLFKDSWVEASAGPFASLSRPRLSYTSADDSNVTVYRPSSVEQFFASPS